MRNAIVMLMLLGTLRAEASQHAQVINLEGCASVGPGPVVLWSNVAFDYLGDSVMAAGPDMGIVACDAELPVGATRFDYAELEYQPGSQVGPPWLVAYALRRQVGLHGTQFEWADEIGSCGGIDPAATPPSELNSPSFPLTICQTPGWLDVPGTDSEMLSLTFVTFVPTNNFASPESPSLEPGGQRFSQGYRLVVYYED